MNLVVVLSAGRFVFQLCANLVLFSITLFLPSSVTDIRSGNRFGQWNSCMRAAVCNVIVDDYVLCVLFVNVWRNQVWLTLPNVVAIPFTKRNTIASYIFSHKGTLGGDYDPIANYIDVGAISATLDVVANRCRSKAYHDYRNYYMQVGYAKIEATSLARVAGRYHLARWQVRIGIR